MRLITARPSGLAIQITLLELGWKIEPRLAYLLTQTDAGRTGSRVFFDNLSHERLCWPSTTPEALERIWKAIRDAEWNQGYAQEKLNHIADWINGTKSAQPEGLFDE